MCNDLVRLAMERACESYGSPLVFNLANLSEQISKLAGVKGPIDGEVLRVILAGRADVRPCRTRCYFEIVDY